MLDTPRRVVVGKLGHVQRYPAGTSPRLDDIRGDTLGERFAMENDTGGKLKDLSLGESNFHDALCGSFPHRLRRHRR